jgi:hypothetical protein
MKIQRRDFLKTSLAASATVALAGRAEAAAGSAGSGGREYYELRAYRLKPGATSDLLDGYLEKALLPGLSQHGIKNVGVFTEVDIDKNAATSKPKADSAVWVLIPHASLESFVNVTTTINTEAGVQKAGADYLQTPKANPAFDRIDSWLHLAFTSMPKLQVPAFSKNKTATRIFELRTYESHSELKALSKIAMFNNGEIDVMKELGMSPVFYGQAIVGRDLPHLSYITGAADLATHLANWKKFGTHPTWVKLKGDPQYADNTSKTGPSKFIVPKPYSVI